MRRDVFQAIADPNRRAILDMLGNEQMSLNQVSEHFDITRSAVSQHIKILTECGLIVIHQKGRERFCEAKMNGLSEVWEWLIQYKTSWNESFDRMDKLLKVMQSKKKSDVKKQRTRKSQ